MKKYKLYKVFAFNKIPATIGNELERILEAEGGDCFGFISFLISSNESLNDLSKLDSMSCKTILSINEYFLSNGALPEETILIKFD